MTEVDDRAAPWQSEGGGFDDSRAIDNSSGEDFELADLDGDGRLDIVSIRFEEDTPVGLSLHRGGGDLTFGVPEYIPIGPTGEGGAARQSRSGDVPRRCRRSAASG